MFHKDSTVINGNHYIQAWEPADLAARNAIVPVAADVGKVAFQLDTKKFHLLANNVGPVWQEIGPPIANTDGLPEGPTNLYHTVARVRATLLTGLSTAAGTVVTAAHTILEAIGFLQKQVSDINVKLIQAIPIACSDEVTALTLGTNKVTFRMPFAMLLSAVRASLTVAQATGVLLTINIKESGVTILSTKITFDNTEKTSTTAVTLPVISDASLANDSEITIDIDQIGDGTAKGLKVYLIGSVL